MSAITRRRLLASAAVAVAAGAGVVAGFARPERGRRSEPAPPPLRDALAREQVLIAGIDSAVAADTSLRPALDPIRADHVAHAAALSALLRQYAVPSASASSPQPAPNKSAPNKSALKAAEQAAGHAHAAASATQTGTFAAILASMAACEAGHAVLLS